MSHLTLEALARLVDEAAAPEEERHLADCARCRAELDALREQQEDLAALPRLLPPPDAWPAIRERLHRERLVGHGPRRRTLRFPAGPLWRAVAAALLFLAGGISGYALRGDDPVPPLGIAASVEESTDPATQATDPAVQEASTSLPGRLPSESPAASGDAAGGQAEVPAFGRMAGGFEPVDRQDQEQGEEGQDAFQTALDQFMVAGAPDAADPAARLATLDNILLITAEALSEAPADPVINGYYRTAVAQRNAILRQIQASRADPVF